MTGDLISEIALAVRTGKIVTLALALDLNQLREGIGRLENLPPMPGETGDALRKLSAERARHMRLVLFFAEQLREHMLPPAEIARLVALVESKGGAAPL